MQIVVNKISSGVVGLKSCVCVGGWGSKVAIFQ